MRKKIMVILISLWFVVPVLSFAKEKEGPNPDVSTYKNAKESISFKYDEDAYSNYVNKRYRIQRKFDYESAEQKKKMKKVQDKGEGQFKIKF